MMISRPRNKFSVETSPQLEKHSAFLRGALTNLLNPKVGIFYVSFLPQFIPMDTAVIPFTLLLGAIHVTLGIGWFSVLVVALQPLKRWLQKASVVRVLDRVTGGIFLGFGLKLAFEAYRTE